MIHQTVITSSGWWRETPHWDKDAGMQRNASSSKQDLTTGGPAHTCSLSVAVSQSQCLSLSVSVSVSQCLRFSVSQILSLSESQRQSLSVSVAVSKCLRFSVCQSLSVSFPCWNGVTSGARTEMSKPTLHERWSCGKRANKRLVSSKTEVNGDRF